MKFLAISTALALSSQVLAAPALANNFPSANGVANLEQTAASAVGGVLGSVTRPAGSTVRRDGSSPADGAKSDFATVLVAVEALRDHVDIELTALGMISHALNFPSVN